MGVILGIDYGQKRTGLAVSDELKMIGSPLETVETKNIFSRLSELMKLYQIESIAIGMPKGLDNKDTDATLMVEVFIRQMKKNYHDIEINLVDERFTSKIAKQSMVLGNLPKMKRRDKFIIDKISAAIILQSFLDR